MKKVLITSIISILTLIILAILVFARVNLWFPREAEARFIYDDKHIETQLSKQDMREIRRILNGRFLYMEEYPSCGFTDSVSVVFDHKMTFCIACDKCPTIYWKEKDRYFDISEWEMDRIHKILEKYGFHFPCL